MSSHRNRKANSSDSRVARTQRSSDGDHSGPYELRSRGKRISVNELFGIKEEKDTKSWADRCFPEDEDNQSVSTPLKNLSMSENSPLKTTGIKRERDASPNSPSVMNSVRRKLGLPAKDDSSTMGSPKNVKPRFSRVKREPVEEYFPSSPRGPTLKDVRARLGRKNSNNNDNDNASTSSSLYSSDTEEGSERNQKRIETDPAVLARRQKQIDYGKNTKGYKLYLQQVPKAERESRHIFTPKKHIKYSRRSWDTQIRIWRKRLHEYDPETGSEEEEDVEVDLGEVEGLI